MGYLQVPTPAAPKASRFTAAHLGRLMSLFLSITVLLVAGTQNASAQDYIYSTGLPSFSTTVPVESGFINLANGNLHLEFPLAAPAQRGSLRLSERLVYDSRIWQVVDNGTSKVWQPTNAGNGGWRFITGMETGAVGHSTGRYIACYIDTYKEIGTRYSKFYWTAPDGTRKDFPITTSEEFDCGGDQSSGSAFATDSSGYRMIVTNYTNATVYAPDGTQVYPTWKDTNGNYQSKDANGNVIDTLGRTPVLVTTSGNVTYYDVLNSQGTRSRYTVTTRTLSVSTAFYQPGVTECTSANGCSVSVVQSIELPDHTSYQFGYDSYGELTTVTLPSGGTITYSYQNFIDAYGSRNRWVGGRSIATGLMTRYIPEVTTCPPSSGQSVCQKVTYSKLSGDKVIYTFVLNGGAWNAQAEYRDSSGATLATVARSYDLANTCDGCTGAAYVRTLTETTTVPTVGGASLSKQTQYSYDSPQAGNLTTTKEWSYYSGSPAATPDRETYVSYKPAFGNNIINKPLTVTVLDKGAQVSQTTFTYDSTALTSAAGVVNHDDVNFGTGNTARGNVTQISRWVANGVNPVSVSLAYDTTGQVRQTTDFAGNVTSFSYADNFFNDNGANPPAAASLSGQTNAYLTQVILPISGTQTFGYFYGTGKQALATDQNGKTAYQHYNDALDRPTQTIDAGGGWIQHSYPSATIHGTYIGLGTATPSTACGSCVQTESTIDAFGRPSRSVLVSDPDGQTMTDTSYDISERVSSITNPYRTTTEPTYGNTSFTYDGLGRVVTSTLPDGNTTQSLFGATVGTANRLCASETYGLGHPTVRIDEVGNKRQFWTDGFGRVIEVDEPDASNNLSVATCYQYDALGNLTRVAQQGQTRIYAYDGLSRLTSSNVPESGTTTYSYVSSTGGQCSGDPGNPCTKTDDRSIKTTYTYDALNRLRTKQYSDGSPTVGFEYDQTSVWGRTLSNTKGRRSHEYVSGKAERIFSYDSAGRLIGQWECLPSNCGKTSYATLIAYDFAGNMTSLTYPSGRTVTYTYSNAGRITQAAMTSGGGQALTYKYSSNIHYAPNGAISSKTIGNSTTPLVDSFTFNNRMQLANATVASSIITPVNRIYGFADGSGKNNGNILSIADQLAPGRTQTFTYDPLNRLASAKTQATTGNDCWAQTFSYDTYGNLLSVGAPAGYSACSAPQPAFTYDGGNHIVGGSYDAVGNLIGYAGRSYQYDPEGRLKTIDAAGPVYTYDSGNVRIVKQVGTDTTEYIALGGQIIAQHSSANWSDWTDLIYVNGSLLAKADSYEDRIHIHGTNCSNCGSQYSLFAFPSAGGYSGYVIRSGDKLFLRQYQSSGARGGMNIAFSDGTNTNWSATDQDGQQINNDATQQSWHYRRVDLSSYAGKSISNIYLVQESTTASGNWDIYFSDLAIVSTDGTVRPLYNRQKAISLSASGTSGVTGRMYEVSHVSNEIQYPDQTTAFYHSDHLGSARLISSVNGYPLWQATYLPFGYEKNPQSGVNAYKFTGYERDAESDLDYANQRYYFNNIGRFMTADPLASSADVTDPQTWNRYAYVRNNPVNFVDPTGLRMAWWEEFGGSGGGFWGATYYVDGVPVTPSQFSGYVGSGAAVICSQCKPGDRVDANNQIWGWIGDTHGVTGPQSPNSPIVVLAYWGIVGKAIGLDSLSIRCLMFCGSNGEDVFERVYPNPMAPTAIVKGPQAPPNLETIKAICTIDAINANNGLGLPAPGVAPSGTESVANGIVFQQRTQHGVRTMNPTAPNINVLGPLAAPGIFVQNSYYNCMSGY